MRYLLLAVCLPLWAQQTIFDVPSGDVSSKGDWFYQHQTVVRVWNPDRRWVQTHAAGLGIGHGVELDGTWYNVERGALRESNASLGFKFRRSLNSKRATVPLALLVGDLVQIRPAAGHLGNWLYGMATADLPRTHTRLTGGVTTGTSVFFGHRTAGLLGGIEQPLGKRWMFQADWFSGKQDLGYTIPGLVYRVQKHWMISGGYQLPNRHARGYRAVVMELTRFP